MPDFLVDYLDIKADDTIAVHDTVARKKPIGLGDNVKTHDPTGNVCYGFVERIDKQCGILWIALDRKTWESRIY